MKTNQTILGRAKTQGLSGRGARTHHHPHEGAGLRPFMRTAVATLGFGRPDHFQRMLRSPEPVPEVVDGSGDIVHFLDGGPGAQQDALRAVIDQSDVPYLDAVARTENYGVGRQLISARRENP